ncbi:imidazolonepropionase [Kordiimonas sp. SCSIO 12603]|uniref:imidazolonepropionase n=1 Tax=Kordiimonas sp. SCSIO 12603 TaxID=2829596 RepID=UPI00210604B5|nr:imidazolonepropionase [Kordiimonas sp. SCSIO 12603]UTW58345.1 imidazolonepropionase [Kordiimonas sp. SCSIO 12603]
MAGFETLYRNVRIATMVKGNMPYGMIEHGAIGVKDGRLAYIGPESELPSADTDETKDCGNMLALPGFIDPHTHIVFGGNRAIEFEKRLNGASYEEIARAGGGILSTVNATRSASLDELTESATKRLLKLKAEGVTTAEIKSGYGLTYDDEKKMLRAAKAAGKEAGIDVKTTFLGAHALPPEFAGDKEGYIDHICEMMLPALAKVGIVDAVDAFCEGIGFSYEQTKRVFETAERFGIPVKLHADQLSDLSGGKLAAEFNALSADHLEYASAESVTAMAEAGTVAVLLPGAYYTLSETKRPPVEMMRQAGVDMALATDANPGSSPVQSLQLMLHMGCTLFGLTPEEAIAGVTRNAAKALGLQDDRGTLEAGKRADILLFDIETPAELCYWVGGQIPSEIISAL